MWQNSKRQIVTKLNLGQNTIGDQTQLMTKLQTSILVRTTWYLANRWDVLCAASCNVEMFLSKIKTMPQGKPFVVVMWNYSAIKTDLWKLQLQVCYIVHLRETLVLMWLIVWMAYIYKYSLYKCLRIIRTNLNFIMHVIYVWQS